MDEYLYKQVRILMILILLIMLGNITSDVYKLVTSKERNQEEVQRLEELDKMPQRQVHKSSNTSVSEF